LLNSFRRIFKEIGKGERIALSKLAVEHLEKTQRPLRIAIDAAIWSFQNQAGQGGKNPALRTLFYRLLRLLALPIHPVFVYDGKNKPLMKRGKTVSRYGTCIPNETSKKLVRLFQFPDHTAPGEAEAECALLQKRGIVDAVMSQDVDAIMFGCALTLRDWSKEGTRGNKAPTHVNVLNLPRIKERTGLDPDGMVLVALLSGGDYDEAGVPGFGPGLACEIARAGFGTDLLELIVDEDEAGLQEWRERLQYELETNESGYFKTKHKSLKVPEDFPNRTILGYYTNPAVSDINELSSLEEKWSKTWDSEVNIYALREYAGITFDWLYKGGAKKFVRCLAPALLARRLSRSVVGAAITSVDSIKERRQHFINDGLPELRVAVVPADVVGLDLEAEEDNPEYLDEVAADEDEEGLAEVAEISASQPEETDRASVPLSPSKKRKSPPWDPYTLEKMWIPETILQLGVPAIVEEWQQIQRDILADPRKFATRNVKTTKAKPAAKIKEKGSGMKTGAIHSFLQSTKPGTCRPFAKPRSESPRNDFAISTMDVSTSPRKQLVAISQGKQLMLPNDLEQVQPLSSFIERSQPCPEHRGRTRPRSIRRTSNEKHSRSSRSCSSRTMKPVFDLEAARDQQTLPVDPLPCPLPMTRRAQHPASVVDERTGNSYYSSIVLSSSPPATSQSPPRAIPGRGSADHNAQDNVDPSTTQELGPHLSASVTTRKKRQCKAPEIEESVRNAAEPPKPRPIESFFGPARNGKRTEATSVLAKNVPGRDRVPDKPPEFSTGLNTRLSRAKKAVQSRDSLPGTWKEIDIDEKMLTPSSGKSKRAPRVSYVDLTGD